MNKKKNIELTETQRKNIYIISLLVFVCIMIAVSLLIGKPLVKYANNPEMFKDYLNSFGIYSRLVFLLIVILQVVIAIIPGEPFEIAAGYCFGWHEGLILTLLGITIGCLLIYVLVSRYKESFIKVFFKEKEFKKLSFLKDPFKAKKVIFILNVIPGIPKDILSYFIGLTPISLYSWLSIVFLGRIPSVLSSTICGDYISKKQYINSGIVILITLLLSVFGIIIYNFILNKYNKKNG